MYLVHHETVQIDKVRVDEVLLPPGAYWRMPGKCSDY